MHVAKTITADGDIFLISGVNSQLPFDRQLAEYVRQMKLLRVIKEITDPADLPEYLSDVDKVVAAAATAKLEQLASNPLECENGKGNR